MAAVSGELRRRKLTVGQKLSQSRATVQLPKAIQVDLPPTKTKGNLYKYGLLGFMLYLLSHLL